MDNTVKVPKANVLSTTLLIAGTCIGGGMLALPVSAGLVGFLPSTLTMIICWLFMTVTGLLILEANLWMEEGTHVITMVSRLLGPVGKVVAWIIYLFVCYASLVAYTAAGGELTSTVIENVVGVSYGKTVSCLIFAVVLGLVLYLGHRLVGRINTILFTGMLVAYFVLVGIGSGEVDVQLLLRSKWSISAALVSIPMLLTSFSYQYIVPSLTPMLKRHRNMLRLTIVSGTTLTLLIYLVWQWLVLGMVPFEGEKGLLWAYEQGVPATLSMRSVVGNKWVVVVAEYFTFFALATSFLGMALGLFDFLSDGLKIKERGRGKIILGLLVVVPTLYFAVNFARIFILALGTSGGFGDAIFSGIMPAMMVWIGRYRQKLPGKPCVPGGKILLIVVFLFSLLALGEMIRQLIY